MQLLSIQGCHMALMGVHAKRYANKVAKPELKTAKPTIRLSRWNELVANILRYRQRRDILADVAVATNSGTAEYMILCDRKLS